MSIQSEIERVRGNIASAYTAVTELGGEVPSAEAQNSGNLAQAVQSIPLGSQLVSLEVDHPPEKVDYFSGEIFDPAGLILEARFSNGALLHLIQPFPEQLTFYPAGPLELGLEHITAKLTWDDVERTCLLPVTVKKKYEAGVDWWEMSMPSSASWQSVTYGAGKFVAVASAGDKAAYSTDGINWTATTLPSSASWQSVTYGAGKFVAVASAGDKAAYSTDGINWTATTLPSSASWRSVTYDDGKFVAVGEKDNTMYSTDGINWTATTFPEDTVSCITANWLSVTYGDGKFVAMTGRNRAAYSTDGINWTATTLPFATDWLSVTYGDGRFVAMPERMSKTIYSTDGINWTEIPLPNVSSRYCVTYADGKFVAVGGSIKAIYSSADGPPA